MPSASFHFPAGFLWGTATAAHQVEGNNTNNNWFAWEEQPGRIRNGHRSGLACDWWGGRWKEDVDRAAETGQNAHRLSIEWSRVQPTPDHWDEDALDHYRQIIRGIVERGMTPMVTLHHFTDPLWSMDLGGWENDSTPARFGIFVTKVVEALKEYVNLWVTINEPNCYFYFGYVDGAFPPGKKDIRTAYKVLCNLVRGHAIAYRNIHAAQREARVGFAINYRSFRPAKPWFPLDRLQASIRHNLWNNSFTNTLKDGKLRFVGKSIRIPEAAKTQDFLGLNYYSRDLIEFNLLKAKDLFSRSFYPADAELSGTGFLANVPEGMYEAIQWAGSYNIPIIITENGTEDKDDHTRPAYLVEHLHQVWRATNMNAPVKGYFHWSQIDNFEWERGWTQRFGLWGLDIETQARIRRPSVDLYAEICRENAVTSSMVQRYTPHLNNKLFPG